MYELAVEQYTGRRETAFYFLISAHIVCDRRYQYVRLQGLCKLHSTFYRTILINVFRSK